MFDTLKTTVCQIAVFMICAQAIAHFRPKEVYEKYLRMLLSVMILIQIFQPFCKLFFGVTGQELSASVEQFQQELDSSMAAAAEQSALAGQKLESMSLLEVQERLLEQESQTGQEEPAEQEQAAGQEEPTGQEQAAEQEQPAGQEQAVGREEPAEKGISSERETLVDQVQIEVKISEE